MACQGVLDRSQAVAIYPRSRAINVTNSSDSTIGHRRFPLAVFIGLAAGVDFAILGIADAIQTSSAFLVSYGVLVAQLNLLSLWAVLGPKHLWRQWLASLLTLAWLYVVQIPGIGYAIARRGVVFDVQQALETMFLLPLVFAIAQTPLWLLRLGAGWHMTFGEGGEAETLTTSRQFGVRHLLTASMAVALILGLARIGISTVYPSGDGLTIWGGVLAASLGLAIAIALLSPLCVWTGMRVRRPLHAIVALLGYSILLSSGLSAIVGLLQHRMSIQEWGLILLFMTVSLGLIFGVLRLARSCGYRLVTAWGRQRETSALDGQELTSTDLDTADTKIPHTP